MYSGRQVRTGGGLIGIAVSGLLLFLFRCLRVADRGCATLGHAFLLQALIRLRILYGRALLLPGHDRPPFTHCTITFRIIISIRVEMAAGKARTGAWHLGLSALCRQV